MASKKTLTDYESRRLENIRRNGEMIAALMLQSKASEISSFLKRSGSKSTNRPTKFKKLKNSPPRSPLVIRRSLRTRGLPPNHSGHPLTPTDSSPIRPFPKPELSPARKREQIRINDAFLGESDASDRPLIDVILAATAARGDADGWYRSNLLGNCKFDPRSSMKLKPENVAKVLPERILSIQIIPSANRTVVAVGNKLGNVGFWDLDFGDGDEDEDNKGIYVYAPHSAPVSGISIHPSSMSKDIMDPDELRRRRRNAAINILIHQYNSYIDRQPCYTSSHIGEKWMEEMLSGHPTRFRNTFRMSTAVFNDLLEELKTCHGLHGSSRTTTREVLGITLYILAQNESIRGAMERFQHSSETISRYFSVGLNSLTSLARAVVKPTDRTFSSIPIEIRHDARYMPFFKCCVGAIDGTHVDARVSDEDKVAFIGRSGTTTQNIMAVCDFNMCFTFALAGWEGSAHDSRIFKFATRNPAYNFPHPPNGKYYLVDTGYPMQRGYLKPYPDTRYHIPDFERASNRTRTRKEVFNKRHSSLRGVIERTFGVWKKKWVILRDMPPYPFPKQVEIVLATMALHNFIRRHPSRGDVDFDRVDASDEEVPVEAFEYRIGESLSREDNITICTRDGEGANEMAELRDEITRSLVGE